MAYVSNDKGWPQNILYGPNSSSFDEDKSIWIYCQVCMKEVKMRYDFKVSIYNEHVLSDSHRDTEVTQENSKTGETSPLKQSSMMSFYLICHHQWMVVLQVPALPQGRYR